MFGRGEEPASCRQRLAATKMPDIRMPGIIALFSGLPNRLERSSVRFADFISSFFVEGHLVLFKQRIKLT